MVVFFITNTSTFICFYLAGILRNLDASETNSLSCHSHLGTENECLNVSSRQNLKKKMPVIFSSEIVSGKN